MNEEKMDSPLRPETPTLTKSANNDASAEIASPALKITLNSNVDAQTESKLNESPAQPGTGKMLKSTRELTY